MGRWSGLSSFIDFHFDHGEPSFRHSLLSTRYHKLDDSIFVLCRNCGQSLKTEENNKMSPSGGGARLRPNPKHFLTWSATAANSRLQKMSKHFVTNISKLHLKVEKAIPFQQGMTMVSSGEQQVCSPRCESVVGGGNAKSGNGGVDHNYTSKNLNDHENNNTVTPDVVQTNHGVSKDARFAPPSVIRTGVRACGADLPDGSNGGSPGGVANGGGKMIQQNVDIGNLQYHGRVQSARIVQSHPSISLSHSTTNGPNNGGSVANPDKIVQFSIDTYNKYAPKELNSSSSSCEVVIEKPHHPGGVAKFGQLRKEEGTNRSEDAGEGCFEGGSRMELCYDSGTGSVNASLSDSSLSSVATLPLTSPQWSRTNSVSVIKDSNLEGTSSILHQSQQQKTNCYNANEKSKSLNENSPAKSHGKSVTFALGQNGKNASQDSNLTNAGVPSTESTDETSLLIDNKKSVNKKGGRKNSSSNARNVEICNNNKNMVVPSQEQKLESNSFDKIQSLISPIYPPSKLAVTIFEEEAELRHTPWFQAGIPREIALEVLRNEPIGSFIVRESTTKSGCFALSLRVPKDHQPGGIAHYLILKTSRGYKIKGFTKEFGSLSSLITHHSVMPELLPCPLSLHRYRPKFPLRVSRANSSDFMEPDKFIIRSFTDF